MPHTHVTVNIQAPTRDTWSPEARAAAAASRKAHAKGGGATKAAPAGGGKPPSKAAQVRELKAQYDAHGEAAGHHVVAAIEHKVGGSSAPRTHEKEAVANSHAEKHGFEKGHDDKSHSDLASHHWKKQGEVMDKLKALRSAPKENDPVSGSPGRNKRELRSNQSIGFNHK